MTFLLKHSCLSMSVNHEIEKAVQIDRPSGTLLRLGKECCFFFSSCCMVSTFLDAIPSWVLSQTCWMIWGRDNLCHAKPWSATRKSQAVLKCFAPSSMVTNVNEYRYDLLGWGLLKPAYFWEKNTFFYN
jgi:hypothetical protein